MTGARTIAAWNTVNTYGAWAVMFVVFVIKLVTFVPEDRGIHSFSGDDWAGVLAIFALLVATPSAWLAALRYVFSGGGWAWAIQQVALYVAAASILTMVVLRMYDADFAWGWTAAVLLNLHSALAPVRRRLRLARVAGRGAGALRALASW